MINARDTLEFVNKYWGTKSKEIKKNYENRRKLIVFSPCNVYIIMILPNNIEYQYRQLKGLIPG